MFTLRWTREGAANYRQLRAEAEQALQRRKARGGKRARKSSRAEGLFKQVCKTVELLQNDPRHPGLNTHEYSSLSHPWDDKQKVFEAYVQNRTPGAYRLFWCYGPDKHAITVIAITPHP